MENKKYIVLDDDPTGIQTVHDVYMITQMDKISIEKAFLQSQNMFYILTNSRAFSKEYTIQYHKELIQNIIDVAKKLDIDFTIISRSDSTLRGHYPTETQVIYDVLKQNHIHIDGESIALHRHKRMLANVCFSHFVLKGFQPDVDLSAVLNLKSITTIGGKGNFFYRFNAGRKGAEGQEGEYHGQCQKGTDKACSL